MKNNINNQNIFWQKYKINRTNREKIHGHKSTILWFTGLSGSGKSTIANGLEKILHSHQISTYIIDGDNIRHGLCSDLNFSDKDRKENIRRVGEVAKLMIDAGLIVLTTLISPYRNERNIVRNMVQPNQFFEIFIDTPLSICENRDPKGLYKKVRSGKINNFTGINSDYEKPQSPEVYLSGLEPTNLLIKKLLKILYNKKIINSM